MCLAAAGGEEDLLSAEKELWCHLLLEVPDHADTLVQPFNACPMKVGRDVWWQGEKEMLVF